jgi:HK97 family phage major capsid protein
MVTTMKDVNDFKFERGQIIDQMEVINNLAASQERDLTSTEQTNYDSLYAKQRTLAKQIERNEVCGGIKDSIDNPGTRTMPDGGFNNAGEVAFLRSGSKGSLGISNAMEIGQDADGGYTVLPFLHRSIIDTVAETNPILAHARREIIDSNEFQQLYTISGAASGRIAEKGTRADSATPAYARPAINLSMQYAYPKITEELALSSTFDIAGHVAREVSTAFDADWEAEMIGGDGVAPNQKGFMTAADSTDVDASRAFTSFQTMTATGAAAITSDEVITLIHLLPLRYRRNAKLFASSAAIQAMRKLKDGDGNYIWFESGSLIGLPAMFLGYEVVEVPQMDPLSANSKPLAFGDMSQAYCFASHDSGLQVLRDPYTTPGYIKYYTRLLCGSGPMDTRALKVLQLAAS